MAGLMVRVTSRFGSAPRLSTISTKNVGSAAPADCSQPGGRESRLQMERISLTLSVAQFAESPGNLSVTGIFDGPDVLGLRPADKFGRKIDYP